MSATVFVSSSNGPSRMTTLPIEKIDSATMNTS